ncbi:glutathione S-transferase family protein [Halocynthiibacter sp. C4]|uniref:glutathione S-transferase family protein n=1 Tax=Halocynthiibacter sp. C4 TaxID=2992758 RepID=UPI00237B23F9|nr:glutathione S-transferase family protein [Halocynthiibacter sp. C4]MDE0588784.1 glutathione S-transferase family protein [Halocynthiibacter sp. C4]
MTIQLYCFGESGHSYKAALALELSGLEWEPKYVDFFNGEARSPEYLKINAMGECPAIVDGDLSLSQSGVIIDYITEKTGKFGGKTPEEKREVLRWVLWDNHKLSAQLGPLRFMMNFLPEEKRNPEVIAFLTGRTQAALKTLESALEGKDWLVGDEITAADLSCCSYLFYPEPFGFTRSDWPNIDAWLARIEALPGYKIPYDLMPGSPADRA